MLNRLRSEHVFINLKINKTAPKSIEFWTKTAEEHKMILNLVNDHRHKSEKLERFTTNQKTYKNNSLKYNWTQY